MCVIFFVVWGVYLNVFITIKSLLSYNQSHENQKETIQSQWTCVLSSTHKPISLLISTTFLSDLANKLKLTLRPAQLRALYHLFLFLFVLCECMSELSILSFCLLLV